MKPSLEIKIVENISAVISKINTVAVFLYTEIDGVLDKVGVVSEKNPFFSDDKYVGIITGTVENGDITLLDRAKQEAIEEGGFDIPDDKWIYLGDFFSSKLVPKPVYCFAADVTGLTQNKPNGDGSNKEAEILYNLVDLDEGFNLNDCLYQTCLFKLFSKKYNSFFNNEVAK
jgi:8-oxo-dGTP pyrophosphatase MutT (NUDIX family)